MHPYLLMTVIAALTFAVPAQAEITAQSSGKEEAVDNYSLVQPLIHYPNELIQTIFRVSQQPEQVALAARYLTDPNSITSEPQFSDAALELMQYPALVLQLSADLLWLRQLGQAVSSDEDSLWASLQDQRLAQGVPDDALEDVTAGLSSDPISVTRIDDRIIYRSGPGYRNGPSIHHLGAQRLSPRRATTYVFPRLHAPAAPWSRHGLHRPPNGFFLHKDQLFGRHSRRWHNSFGWRGRDDFLHRHQRQLRDNIGRQRRAERRGEHHQQHRPEHRREHRREHRQEHRAENRREHRQEHRQKNNQDRRNGAPQRPERRPPRAYMGHGQMLR